MFPDLTRDDVFRLETRRLWLRWPRRADAPDIVRLAGDEAVAEMTAHIPHPYPLHGVDGFILAARQENCEGQALSMTVTPRSKPGAAIGRVRIGPGEAGAELDYWIGTPFWGQGFATEACHAMIDAYFGYAGGGELFARARVINTASRRVIEKCGFVHIGSGLRPMPAPGGVCPAETFRLDRQTWLSFKAWSHTGFVPQECHGDRAAAY